MIIVLKADVAADAPEVAELIRVAERHDGITTRVHQIQGTGRALTEIYLLGPTVKVPTSTFARLPIGN